MHSFLASLYCLPMRRQPDHRQPQVHVHGDFVGAEGPLARVHPLIYLDVGAGQTDLTWQAIGGVGYKFNWGEVFGVWRYLDYNFKSSSKIEALTFNGPAIGVAFSW